MIQRQLAETIEARLGSGKAVLIFGARQVGKTTLVRELLKDRDDVVFLNADAPDVRALLAEVTPLRWQQILGTKRTLFIDEAQRVSDIGLKLKLITDELPDVTLIASGSSSFELANQVNEPLTGRKREFILTPLSFAELTQDHGLLDERRSLAQRLVFGAYPEVVTSVGNEQEVLTELASSYLYKDILAQGNIKKSERVETLLKALALQVGQQVSYNELAQLCGLDGKTVEKYLSILEQAYLVFRLGSFSRNLRNELKFSRKVYFYDNGIRNAIIGNYSLLETRTDIGSLWENYLVSERVKRNLNLRTTAQSYFWRSTTQQEIDYLEEENGRLRAFEFKWNEHAKYRRPARFLEHYGLDDIAVISPANYDEFLS